MIQDAGGDSNRLVYKRFIFFLGVLFLIGVPIGVSVLLNISQKNDKQALVALEKIKRDLEKEQQELKVSIEFEGSPERIESLALGHLGMVPVTGDRVYLVQMRQKTEK